MSEWKTIASAPKVKGASVIGWFEVGGSGERIIGEITYEPDWIANQQSPWLWSRKDDTFIVQPAAWMPLPSPPTKD